MQPESLYPKDWLRIAEKDWRRVDSNLTQKDIEDAGVHLQQAIEKFLKAFLLSRGWKLRRTHDLELLLNEAIAYRPEFERFTGICQTISGFYFTDRYPLLTDDEPTENEITEAKAQVSELVESIRDDLQLH